MRVPNKRAFYRLMKAGRTGNRLPYWSSVSEALSSGYRGLVGIRHVRSAAWRTRYFIPMDLLEDEVRQHCAGQEGQIIISPMAPDHLLYWQGELTRGAMGLEGVLAFEPIPMKKAMLRSRRVAGLELLMLMRRTMLPSSYDDVHDLLDEFPTAILEVGVYRCQVGDCVARNVLIWEVRDY